MSTESQLITFWAFFALIIGLALGSFANVLIHRLPLRQSIIKPSSHCPNCKNPIKFYHNIPIVSYLILKGKCRYCGEPISPQYPLVEAAMGGILCALVFRFGVGAELFFYGVFIFIMIVHAVIDFKDYLLLDVLNIAAGLLGLTGLILFPIFPLIKGLIGAVIGGGLLLLIYLVILILFKKEGLGQGDIKTAAVIGLFLGPVNMIFTFIIASIVGILWGIVRMAMGKGRLLPFGTMLAVGAVVVIFWGEKLVKWIYF